MADLRSNTGGCHRLCTVLRRLLAIVTISVSGVVAMAQQIPPVAPPQRPAATATPGAPVPPGTATPTNSPSVMVVDVRIVGNKSLPLDKILPHIHTRVGRPFDLELIEEDVRRLDHTRMFVNVKTYWQQVAGGRVVIFDLLERPLLTEVLFVGCKEVRKKTLQKEAAVKAGDPADPFAIEEARRKLEEYYRSKGFSGARVTLLEGDKPEDRRAIFLINEGMKQQVWNTAFVGNTIANDDRLRTQISTSRPFLWFFGGEFDRKKLDEDVRALTAYYRGLGFFRARIGRDVTFNAKKNWVTITFIIDEGPRYKIRSASVVGNTKYGTEELLGELKLKSGDYYNQSQLSADVRVLSDKYGSIGYVFADVKGDLRFLEEANQLDLVYNIKEGDRYRVGKIDVKIKGEYPHTQLTTVLNRLSIKPGDIIDIREIRASERRLRASQLFEANPANGNAPKIVFSPPGQGKPGEEEDDKTEVADRRKSERKRPPGTNFRGQSPDPEPRERVLDLTLDCGRYVGPKEEDLRGDREEGRGERKKENAQEDELLRAARELSDALSHQKKQRRSLSEVIPTQYTPDAGQANPASQQSWLPWPNTTTSTSTPAVAQTTPAPSTTTTQPAPVQPAPPYGQQVVSQGPYLPGPIFSENSPFYDGPPDGTDPARALPFTVTAEQAMTGRLMFAVGVNSDSGLVGSIVLDEQNFDWTRFPSSWEDVRNATAWRGAGQRFRLEAAPGTEVSRYLVEFQDPYLFNTQISLGLSGYYYTRIYNEYRDQRLGGRVALGYQLTPDLSGNVAYRGAKINITDPIDAALPDLAEVTGRDLALHGFQVGLTLDKRDSRFLATEGYLIETSFEQVLGSFQYPRVDLDVRKYFTIHERPDGSGRHVLSLAARAGFAGDNTPIYDRYYAGGFSTIRGFQFRCASPSVIGPTDGALIFVGGDFQLLASAEYLFPITADDMLRGVVFCDTGTVEPTVGDWNNKYRVAPGFGLRIVVPAMGPAPIALDFAFPVSWQPGDRQEMFSFFVGFLR